MSENHGSHSRLDSWKEISDYLRRDVRTVIRWEKDKRLPIHRIPGGKRQSVFAYTDEIDAWLDSHCQDVKQAPANIREEAESSGGGTHECALTEYASEAIGVSPSAQQQEHSLKTSSAKVMVAAAKDIAITRMGKRILAATIVCLLGIAGISSWLSHINAANAIYPLSFKQLTDDGRVKGNVRSNGSLLLFTETEGARSILASTPISGAPVRPIQTPFTNVAIQDLSNDGENLLFLSYEGITIEGPLWTIPVRGGTPHRIGEGVCAFARWSPNNSKIACAYGTSISVMNSDGSNIRAVGAFSSPVGPLIWTPDGNRLRFILESAANHMKSQWEIEVNQENTTAQARELGLGTNCCTDWTWTHDGKNFIYTEIDEFGKSHLKVQNDRSTYTYEVPLTVGTLWAATPGTTKDSLLLVAGTAFRGELLKFEPKQNTLRSYIPGLSAAFLAFSPDGQWITYATTQDSTLWRSRIDGSDALQLTRLPMEVEVSSWAPDGEHIAFMACTPGKPWRIYVIDRNGRTMHQIGEGTDSQGGPSWSPDGKFIVYGNVDCEKTQSCWIRRIDAMKGTTEILPGSRGFRTARWSPDGKYIAALRFQTHELMLFDILSQQWRVLADSVKGDNINWSSDSQYIYVDSPRDMKPVIERLRITDRRRETVVGLDSLQKIPGTANTWFGLAPDDSPILAHMFTSAEIYELKWVER